MKVDFTVATSVYLGSTKADAVYLGDKKIWPIQSGPIVHSITVNPNSIPHRTYASVGPVIHAAIGDIIEVVLPSGLFNNYGFLTIGFVPNVGSAVHRVSDPLATGYLQQVSGEPPTGHELVDIDYITQTTKLPVWDTAKGPLKFEVKQRISNGGDLCVFWGSDRDFRASETGSGIVALIRS